MNDAKQGAPQRTMVDPQPGSIRGPRESPEFHHLPVMVNEIADLVRPLPPGTFLDATVGGAGHATAVLEANPDLHLLGVDQDPLAIDVAQQRLAPFRGRYELRRGRFDRMVTDRQLQLSGFLFDLGVSSPQLDRAERGFSFRHDGPLDMRMDPDQATSALDVVNTYPTEAITEVLRRYGDEKFSSRIARSIVANRPVETTNQLAEIVVQAIPAPARRRGGHPAKRTFQALRIEVNQELTVLRPALEAAVSALVVGGRGLILTYHSGEDRIVKDVIRANTTTDEPVGLPVAGAEADFVVVRPAARKPSAAEQHENPRSTSARLRVLERRAR